MTRVPTGTSECIRRAAGMRNSEPPPRRSSIPPATADYLRACYEGRHPSPAVFKKHKELASFLAADSTKIFLIFISHPLKKSIPSPKKEKEKEVLHELNSRMPNHLNHIFAELSAPSREAIFALRKKIADYSALILSGKGFPNTERLEEAILLARSLGKNAELNGATPAETSLVVCGVFGASAKVFQSQNKFAAHDFIRATEKISLQVPTQALITFLWKIADSKNAEEISTTISGIRSACREMREE